MPGAAQRFESHYAGIPINSCDCSPKMHKAAHFLLYPVPMAGVPLGAACKPGGCEATPNPP
jgi:hypothetical protein